MCNVYMTENEYLRTNFEHPHPEFVDGALEERGLPTYEHGDWMLAIAEYFRRNAKQWNIRVVPELHTKTRLENWRIPDVAVFDRMQPLEQRLTKPPIAVFEVLSPDQREEQFVPKFTEYEAMGIPHIWFVDPKEGTLKRWVNGELQPLPVFSYEKQCILFAVDEIKLLLQH